MMAQAVKMSLLARKGIRDDYDTPIKELLDRAQRYTSEPELKFEPNFEDNYAKMKSLEARLDRREPDDNRQLSKEWQENLGRSTKQYFEGFVDKLQRMNIRQDDLIKQAFKNIVYKNVVILKIVENESQVENPSDCIIEDGQLIMRATFHNFYIDQSYATKHLGKLL